MAFCISGTGKNGPQAATRQRASSAIVLAFRWEIAGVRNVRIKDSERAPESPEGMRLRLYGRQQSD